MILDALRTALEDKGSRVGAAVDGEALDAARDDRPDVILLDLRMLGMSGEEGAERLHSSYETAAISVIVTSAHNQLRAITPGLPVVARLPKPIDLAQLSATVARWTEGAIAP